MTRETQRAVVFGWLLAAVVLTLVSAPSILHLWFPDPDDAMRLLEVRDWLYGQSWWDVSQHRLWGGAFQMHWSRLVDLPLAAIVIAVRWLLGEAMAERLAMVVVPLLTLLAAMLLIARITALLAGEERARLAVLLTALSPAILYQIRPMRIDHHGWQVVLALGATLALLLPPSWRRGAIAGACLGALIIVSLEGLPVTVAIVGVALLAWMFDDQRRSQTAAMIGTLLGSVVLLQVVTRGPTMMQAACDAIAPAWIAGLAIACTGAMLTIAISPRVIWLRCIGLAISGTAGLAALTLAAPRCLEGPFATLDPLVYQLWYSRVLEGLPAWQQLPSAIVMAYAMPLVGIAGTIAAWRASHGPARFRWAMTLALLLAAFVFSLLIIRSAATANAFAVPGVAWLLLGWLTRARALGGVVKRTVATAAAFLAAAPGLAGSLIAQPDPLDPAATGQIVERGRGTRWCDQGREIDDLRYLPPGRVFAPVDITPAMIATTAHEGIAAGYHRNPAAIRRVMATFLSPPETARGAVIASGADYIAGCPGVNETQRYKLIAPHGLWARLERGERFAWLHPIRLPGSPVLAWQVIRMHRPLPQTSSRP